MANYNTRGMSHKSVHKEFDEIYNSGAVWSDMFQEIFDERIAEVEDKNLNYNSHVYEQIMKDINGNRVFSIEELALGELRKGTVVEAETRYEMYGDEQMQTLRKAVVRLPVRPDGEQVVAVVDFPNDKTALVRTAWLNKATDNHEIGLDTADFTTKIEGKFGFINAYEDGTKVWQYQDGHFEQISPQMAKTISQYITHTSQSIDRLQKDLISYQKRGKVTKATQTAERIVFLQKTKKEAESRFNARNARGRASIRGGLSENQKETRD